jgi:type I restriction enzyme S subunit
MNRMNEEQELPQGWVWTTIEELAADTMIGLVRSALEQNSTGSGVPYVKMNNLNLNGQIETSELVSVQASPDEISRYSLRSGDILFNTRNSVELVGKVGIFRGGETTVVYNNNLMRMRFVAGANPDYMVNVLRSPDVKKRLDTIKRATTSIAAIYAKDFLPFAIPLPPLPEQRRIVAKLEELFSKLDAGVAAVRRSQALLKRYRQSVLHAAVTGVLTRAWREAHPPAPAETGAALLQRIRAERRAQWEAAQMAKRGGELPLGEGWKSKYAEPEAVDAAGLSELPEGWALANMKLLTSKITDGEHLKPAVIDSGVPFLSAKDVRESGVIFSDCLYVSQSDAAKFRTKCNPSRGDILMVSRGATVGRSCIVNTDQEFCLLGSVILLKVIPGISSKFLLSVITSPANSHLLSSVSGATAQQAIYLRDIEPMAIPLPPLAEQAEIVAEVERRLTVLDALSQTLTHELRRAERLRQSILHRAFTGHLVPQEATDEPAAALLARLRETPAAPAKAKAGRGRKATAQQATLDL